jgi:hypothetical protein
MDIVRITMEGYGCEIHRGIVPREEYLKIKNSVNDVWNKDLFKKIKKEVNLKKEIYISGLIKGEVKIEIDDTVIIETSINSFEALVNYKTEVIKYPATKDVVVTSVQHQEGVFLDTIFVIDDKFDLDKVTIIKKDVNNKIDNTLVSSLYCELYYDGYLIPMTENITDLRMSRLYFENTDKDKDEQNEHKQP